MSKFATVAVVALLVAVALAGKTFEIINFPNLGCTGKAVVSNVPVDTCFPAHFSNYSMMDFKIPGKDADFAVIYPQANGTNCANKGIETAVECGRCMDSGVAAVGFYRYDCNTKTKEVHASDQCNNDCSTCNKTTKITVGSCHKYNNGTEQIYLSKIVKDKVLEENLYYGKTCSGSGSKQALRCGACYASSIFNCTLTGDSAVEQIPKSLGRTKTLF